MPEIIEIETPAINEVIAEGVDTYDVFVSPALVYEIEAMGIIQGGGSSEPPYIKVLTGTSITVLQAEHLLTLVRGLRVYNSITGEVIDTAEIILNNNVTINSNFDLTNYSLMIY